jgi:6-phosphogluconolactonase/glucosamine-6-phosphate isomerase/deaminase
VLRSARELLFLVTGENKADAARRSFAGEPSKATPGSLLWSAPGRTTAVLDVAAAARL